jgi:hypothetical protein
MSATRPRVQARASRSVLFSASRRLLTLEHFRIPYQVSPFTVSSEIHHVRTDRNGASLLWPTARARLGPPGAAMLPSTSGRGVPIFARVTSDRTAASLLARQGGSWTPVHDVISTNGERLASIWRGDDGSWFLPFDPDEVRLNYISERYREIVEGHAVRMWRRVATDAYYGARGMMPRPVQIWLRRHYARAQARTSFPRWPIETGLHDFLEILLAILQSIAGEPVPTIAAWPKGNTWALVLTHDVETDAGLGAIDSVLDVERSFEVRSSWNFVPRRYEVSARRVRALISEGFEVGVHGLYHDGRDLESSSVLRERLPGMRHAAAQWNATGFRSPATRRDWELMPLLGFDYDSSYPDTDPFDPQGGGCCTWLPFFNEGMVELPLTMVQDHTLFTILRQPDEKMWVQKGQFLRSRGGMVLLDTHPDYLTDSEVFAAYERFLQRFAHTEGAWEALPGEVNRWWRRRAQSHLERVGDAWRVGGAARVDARVELVTPDAQPRSHQTPFMTES